MCILEGGSLIVTGTEKRPPTRCDKNVSKRTSSGIFSQYFLALPSDSVFGVRRLCQKVLWKEGRRISNTPWAEGRRISHTLWAEGRRKLLLASFIRFLQMTQYGRNNALKRVEGFRFNQTKRHLSLQLKKEGFCVNQKNNDLRCNYKKKAFVSTNKNDIFRCN